MTLPTFQGIGTGSETSCAWPTHTTGDLGILFVEHGGGTVATPTGCTIVPGFPVVLPSAASTLSAFYRYATGSSEAALALSGGTDHMWGVICTVRGADTTAATALHRIATTYAIAATTTAYHPGTVTTAADCLVINVLAWVLDSAGPLASAQANANLGSVTEQYDAGTTTANGGGLVITTGTLATAGPTGITTVTLTSTTFECATIAIAPPQAAGSSTYSRGRVVNG